MTDEDTTRNQRAFDVHELLDELEPNTPRWRWVTAAIEDARRDKCWNPVHAEARSR